MHTTSLKNALLASLLLAAGGYASSAVAHNLSGSLGTAAKATDLMQITCFDDGFGAPHHLDISISDSPSQVPTPNPIISIQGINISKKKAANSSDPAEDTKYSPEVTVVGGSGPYIVTIDHNKAGSSVENYTASFHCMTSTNQHTGTNDPTILQNQ